MSIDDLPYTADEAYQGGFERTPPQDIPAEQSVLGGMLLSKDAIAEVIEVIKATDFYKPAHEAVFSAVLELYGRGEPADPVTVAALLTKKGDINRIGGAPYLHTLINSVPTAANAGYYAEIVKERAILRRLVEAGTRIVQMGYSTDGSDVEQIVDAAQQEMYNVTEARTSEDYIPLADAMEGALDEIESISNRSGQMTGVPTGFHDLDALTNGLHPGQMVIIAARPAIGKALALDTPLPTPTGWTTMGAVRVGDRLLGADGKATRVVAATEVMTGRPCYEVEFSDGSVIVADAQHQWFTETRAARRGAAEALVGAGGVRAAGGLGTLSEPQVLHATGSVKTTEEIARTLRSEAADGRPNHSVPVAAAVDLPDADLPLSPYALGVWLGDG
ncbi:MAG: DnaB-like helicase N-terminal domain-containing protein, partial [Catenulispora sp.]